MNIMTSDAMAFEVIASRVISADKTGTVQPLTMHFMEEISF